MKELETFDPGKVGKLYTSWYNMLRRCYRDTTAQWEDYGGRGITVESEWHNFDNFYIWALNNGFEIGLQLDRIDVNKGYSPANCRYVTQKKNARNKRNSRYFTAFGEAKILMEWAEDDRCVVNYGILRNRLYQYGWTDVEKALTYPPARAITKRNEKYEYQNNIKTLSEWGKDSRSVVSYVVLYGRVIMSGWDIERALTTPLLRDIVPEHGTVSRFRSVLHRCSCTACRIAINEYNKQWQ